MIHGIGFTVVAFAVIVSAPIPPREAQQSETYLLADRVIDSLETLGEVRDLMDKIAASANDPKMDPLEVSLTALISLRTAITRTHEAREGLDRFLTSENKMVKVAAFTLDTVAGAIGISLKQLLEIFESLPASTDRKAALSHIPKFAEVISQLDDRWRSLRLVLGATTHALVDQSRVDGDGKVVYLNITATEREALRKRIAVIRIEKMRHQVDLTLSVLRDFLMDDRWKPR